MTTLDFQTPSRKRKADESSVSHTMATPEKVANSTNGVSWFATLLGHMGRTPSTAQPNDDDNNDDNDNNNNDDHLLARPPAVAKKRKAKRRLTMVKGGRRRQPRAAEARESVPVRTRRPTEVDERPAPLLHTPVRATRLQESIGSLSERPLIVPSGQWRLADEFEPHPLDASLPKNMQRPSRRLLVEPLQRVFADDDAADIAQLHAALERRERLVRGVWISMLPQRKLKTVRDPTGEYRALLDLYPEEAAAIRASLVGVKPASVEADEQDEHEDDEQDEQDEQDEADDADDADDEEEQEQEQQQQQIESTAVTPVTRPSLTLAELKRSSIRLALMI
jgi:hypothetical protein